MELAGKNVKDCLMEGFAEEKVVFFPDIKFRDLRGSKKVWWNFRDFIQLQSGDRLSTVAAMTLSVCTEMERQSLAYMHLSTLVFRC